MPTMSRPAVLIAALTIASAGLLVGCATPRPSGTESDGRASVQPSPSRPRSSSPTSTIRPSPAAVDRSPSVAPLGSVAPTDAPNPPAGLALTIVTNGLEAPTDIAWHSSAPGDLFVLEQAGRIRIVRDNQVLKRPFLDIAGKVSAGGEQGLLGMAFAPRASDDRFYVYYTALDGAQVLASYRTAGVDPDVADPASESILLSMPDRFPNHNGGGLAFGSDGMLYVGTGDGGGAGDPLGSGRDLGSLLAKVLRLDVSGAGPYAVPTDNPFVGTPGARPETWLTGLRNPWRIRFDGATGDLWIGDVGQNAFEEVDVARGGTSGLDYGWNLREGLHCYPSGALDGCLSTGLTTPVAEYGHDLGCSVTGGMVYRGNAIPDLIGWYVFADYCSGRVWVVPADGDGPAAPRLVLSSGRAISSIVDDADGELLLTDYASGSLLRITAGG